MKDFNNINNIEKLEEISTYINDGLSTTIKKQFGKLELELEKKYAIEYLKHFINGENNAFTSLNNIRTNVKSIDIFYIYILLIKSAIERHAFNIVKLKKEKLTINEDVVAETISEQIALGHLNDILNWIISDSRVIFMLIENYINFSYKSSSELNNAYAYICKKNATTNKALEQLNLKLKSMPIKSK